MKKVSLLVGLLLALGAMKSEAAGVQVFVSSQTVAGVVAVSTPTSGTFTSLKACAYSNDTSVASCVKIQDNTTVKLVLCAAAQGTTQTQAADFGPIGARQGSIPSFFGGELVFSGALTVVSSTPSASAYLTCSYETTRAD